MIVTSYYDIYNKPERFIEYLYLFYDIGISGVPIILFTDPLLVKKFRIFPPSVKVIGMPLEIFELYLIGKKYTGKLPNGRNETKDTKEFYSLMNTKIEFILRAAEMCDDNNFIWVDFGILKIIKNTERFINKLKSVNEQTYDKITIPGCWAMGRGFSVVEVTSRFCGGIFVIPRQHNLTLYKYSLKVS